MSITYEEILNTMVTTFEEESGYSADDASDIGIRLKVLAGEIYNCYTNIDWLKMQVFPQTAIEEQLDYHAQERGIERNEAGKSTGTLTFSRSSALSYDISIPKGTICSTSGVSAVNFVTTADATLLAGSTSVDVAAEAEVGGTDSNVCANTITVMVTPPSGITSVKNDAAFTGGTNAETDDELRDRILDSYKNIPNGTNCAFYIDQSLKYDGVYSANAIAKARGNGTVDVYVAGKGAAVSNTLLAQIASDMDELREINVDLEVKNPTFFTVNIAANIVVKSGYDFDTVKADCIANISEFVDSIKIGDDLLKVDIGDVLYHTDGVQNYTITSGVITDITADDDELIKHGTITISEVS